MSIIESGQGRLAQRVVLAMPWVFVLIWSTGFIVARYGMPHSPPFKFLTLRYGFSIICFALWIAIARPAWPRDRTQAMHLTVVGILMQAGYLGGVWSAVKIGIGAGTVALIVGLQPVLTAVWLTVGNGSTTDKPISDSLKVSSSQWLGLVLGLSGLTLVVWHKLGGGEVTLTNLMFAVCALFSITAGTLYQKRHVAPCDVRTASLVQLTAALLISLPLALHETEPVVWQAQMIGALAWSVVALTLGGSSLLYLLIQRGAATQVTSLMYLVPPSTAVLAWLLFDEPLTFSMVLGMALTVGGVAMVVRNSSR